MHILCSIDTLEKTRMLSEIIAQHTKKSDLILLKGDLGSGKTTFAQFFIQHLTNATNIQSPTFSIVNIYHGRNCSIWHYDLYRLKHPEELYEIGVEESISNGISIIEWPELIESIVHENKIIIYLENKIDTNYRTARIELCGRFIKEEQTLLKKLENEFK